MSDNIESDKYNKSGLSGVAFVPLVGLISEF